MGSSPNLIDLSILKSSFMLYLLLVKKKNTAFFSDAGFLFLYEN